MDIDIKTYLNSLFKGIKQTTFLYRGLEDITEILELQNQVAKLSSYTIAENLMWTIKKLAYESTESNKDFICRHLKNIINDLYSGVDAVDILNKYDAMLYKPIEQRSRGYRAKMTIYDDAMIIDGENINENT